MPNSSPAYIREIQAISSVPHILETVASVTGLGFVAIAHVTEYAWNACAVLDRIDFGMQVGDSLDVSTTLCDEVRTTGEAIIIDCVRDSERYRDHHTPRLYGFESYFALPILRKDGSYFGTLCGLDPQPHALSTPTTVDTLRLFAELISRQLDTERNLATTRIELLSERETTELREQFVAVLGHDLRTPLTAIQHSVDLLRMTHPLPDVLPVLDRVTRSVHRIADIVDDVVDFTRGRMGAGMGLALKDDVVLDALLGQVIDELRSIHRERAIKADIQPGIRIRCDPARLGQLLSNLLTNALVHGDPAGPVRMAARCKNRRFILAVSNHGSLPQHVLAHLFEPFRRGHADYKHDGLGLGLYIVDQIARAHGGTMTAASLDGNVTFTFLMPA